MRNGSQASTGAQAGDPIAVLRREPEDLSKSLRIKFRTGHDDLDWLRLARIRTANGRSFSLVRHRHAPRAGTEVVAAAPSTDPWADILAVLQRLKLTENDLTWWHPAAKPHTTLRASAAKRTARSATSTGTRKTNRAAVRKK